MVGWREMDAVMDAVYAAKDSKLTVQKWSVRSTLAFRSLAGPAHSSCSSLPPLPLALLSLQLFLPSSLSLSGFISATLRRKNRSFGFWSWPLLCSALLAFLDVLNPFPSQPSSPIFGFWIFLSRSLPSSASSPRVPRSALLSE